MVTFKKLAIGIILPLVALILILLWQTDSFQDVKDSAEGFFEEYSPDVDVGLEDLEAEEVSMSAQTQKETSNLKAAIDSMYTESSKSDCFMNFGGFRKELGDTPGKLIFSFNYNSQSKTTTVKISSKAVVYETFQLQTGVQPCVIAGRSSGEEVAEQFFEKFVEGNSGINEDYVMPVDSVSIYYDEKRLNGNVIRVSADGWKNSWVNDESDNFETDLIFKGPNNELCFFPSNKIYNYDEDGIDNDYLLDVDDDDSLPYKIAHNPTLKCAHTEPEK